MQPKTLKYLFILNLLVVLSSLAFADNKALDTMKSDAQQAMQNVKSESKTLTSKAENVLNKEKSAVTQKAEKSKESAEAKVKTTESKTTAKKVDINKADEKALQNLPGIGEAKAKAIIEYREKTGKIKNLEELSKVSGIGDATLEKIKPLVKF